MPPLPMLASPATPWTCEDWREGVCTGPQTRSILTTCLINTMGRRTSSGACSNGPQHSPFNHKTAHFTVCQAPGQNEHQFFIKQLQRNVLKAGSKTTSVPVVTMKPADVNPPAPALTPLTHENIERIVLWSSSNLRRRNKQRLVLLVDIQSWFLCPPFFFFYQQGPARYFCCSTKVFNAYSD